MSECVELSLSIVFVSDVYVEARCTDVSLTRNAAVSGAFVAVNVEGIRAVEHWLSFGEMSWAETGWFEVAVGGMSVPDKAVSAMCVGACVAEYESMVIPCSMVGG